MARFPSGQRGRTVNPLAQPSQVRILLSPPSGAVAFAKDGYKVGCNNNYGMYIYDYNYYYEIMYLLKF